MDLTERETKVLKLRFGICGQERETVYDIACRFKVTRNRIYQIQHKALRKLAHPNRRDHPMIGEILKSPLTKKMESSYPSSYMTSIIKRLRKHHKGK